MYRGIPEVLGNLAHDPCRSKDSRMMIIHGHLSTYHSSYHLDFRKIVVESQDIPASVRSAGDPEDFHRGYPRLLKIIGALPSPTRKRAVAVASKACVFQRELTPPCPTTPPGPFPSSFVSSWGIFP